MRSCSPLAKLFFWQLCKHKHTWRFVYRTFHWAYTMKKFLIKISKSLACLYAFIVLTALPGLLSLDNQDHTEASSCTFLSDKELFSDKTLAITNANCPDGLRTVNVDIDDIALLFGTYPLSEPLWLNTRAPAGRDVLYLLPQKLAAIEYGGLAVTIFYNQTNRMPLSVKTLFGDLFDQKGCTQTPPFQTEKCDSERGFIHLLTALIEGATEGSDIDARQVSRDIVTLYPLLQNMTIQQRQLGIFFQYGIPFGPFMFQIHTPFIVSERNFWLSLRNIDTISDIMKTYYQGSDFDYSQVVQFKAGLGDTRLKLGLNMVNMTNFALDFGAESIIPTSLIFYKADFRSAAQRILNGASIPRQQFESNMANVLQGIRDYFLEPRLGNGGHFGLGIFLESKCGLFHDFIQLWSRFSYDLLLKAKEDRLFPLKATMTVADLEPVIQIDEAYTVQERADILENYLRQYIFPSTFRCTIKPGGVFNAVLGASVNYKQWRFTLGYDFYACQRERVYSLDKPKRNLFDVDIEKGIANHVEQHKIFTESLYNWSGKKSTFALGYGTDVTLFGKNIGNDWSVYFKLVASF